MIRKLLPIGSALFLILVTFTSCEKDFATPRIKDLYGNWRMKNLSINGQPATNFAPFTPLSLFGLQESGRFYFDYNGGTWTIDGNQLVLRRGDDGPIFRDYTIIHSSKDSLVVSALQVEGDLYTNFPQFGPDQRFLTITHFGR